MTLDKLKNRFRKWEMLIAKYVHYHLLISLQCLTKIARRKQKALSMVNVEDAMKQKCCKANCVQMKLSKSDIVKTRTAFRSMTEEAQRSFLLNFFLLSQYFHKGKRKYTFCVNGKNVCRLAWMRANSVSPTT